MKYAYKISLPASSLIFAFFDENRYIAVECFLASDIQAIGYESPYHLNLVEGVLQQKVPFDGIIGNVCDVDIYKDFTRIEYLFPEDEDMEISCTIETEELRKLIILWMTEVEKLRKIKKNIAFKSLDPEYKIYCFLASIYHQFVNNFDLLLDQYLASETAESRTQLIVLIEQFFQSDESIELKNEYIKLCADSVYFDELKIAPVAWLEIILQYIKNNKNCSQNAKNTVST